MSGPVAATPARAGAAGAPLTAVLQRKCACGSGGSSLATDCPECRLKKTLGLQPKLTLGGPNDPLESEADRIADQVLAAAAPTPVTRRPGAARDAVARRAPVSVSRVRADVGGAAPAVVGDVLRAPGQPLDAPSRDFMETRFGHDFGHVRVHTGARAAASANAVAARAYTVGHDVVFAAGEYAPGTSRGRRLLAHELAHTLQQASAPTILQRACGPAAIGSVAGCTARGGDIVDFGGSSDRIFLFEQNCDDFKPGEPARLRALAATISPLDQVQVDGFSSEEGDPAFNEELSCARANAAANVLVSEGVSATIGMFKHGATPGSREDRRSAVVTIEPTSTPGPEPEPEPEPEPAPPARPRRPAASTEDCSAAQTAMLQSALDDARLWVDDATRKVTDYAFVFASSRHSAVPASPATAAVVRGALNDNFHTTSSGHVLQIRDGFQELRRELNRSLTFECEGAGCDDLAYVRGAFAAIRRLGDIHVCPPWFACADHNSRVSTVIHERAHQHPGATDNAYEFEGSYATLSPADAIDNAESYAVAARQIFHGGAQGPGAGRC